MLRTQPSNMSATQRMTFKIAEFYGGSTIQPHLPANIPRIFSPPYQVVPKFCPRSSSLESKKLMLSKGNTTMYTFLTSTQVNLIGSFPFSFFQSIQIPSRDGRPPLPSAVCYTVCGTPISTYPLRSSTLIAALMDLKL